MRERWPWDGIIGKRTIVQYLRRYHRWTVEGELIAPTEPTLFVSHHGYGSAFDLNIYTALGVFDKLGIKAPVTLLAHELAWTIGIGKLLERYGAKPASKESAFESFATGRHALVMPGGDVDGFKPFHDRHRIVFDGRTGFAQLAIDTGVPLVPIVTAGAGNTILSLSDGRALAKALKLDRLLRLKAIPATISVPWGFNIGLVGFAPHLPLPAKLTTRVLPAMWAEPGEDAEIFAARVELAMQDALSELVHRNSVSR